MRAGIAAGCVALQAALALTGALTTNPDYNFPGIIELALIGTALLCLAAAFGFGVRWDRDDRRLAAALAVLLTLLVLRYLSALADPSDGRAMRCFAMPGLAGTAECLLQLPFWTNYGLRQLLMHTTALVVFWAAAGLARTAGGRVATFAPIFLVTPLVFAVASVAPKFILGQQTLAGWNLVLNAFTGTARSASGLTSNPGWLWPLMAAPAALALGLLAGRSWPRIAAGVVVIAAILFAVADAGQRGGYVLVALLAACALVYACVWRVPAITGSWRWRTLSWAIPVVLTAVAVWAGAGYLDAVLGWLAQFPLFASFAARDFVLSDSSVRGVMWQCAWDNLQPVLWTGNGYASWLRVAGSACGSSPFIYDTAHNLWVQMLFELGAIHTLLVVGLFVWGVDRIALVRTNRPLEIEAAVLAVIPAFLLVSMVQEVDYIPATYYAFAVVGGLLWGASRRPAAGAAVVPDARVVVRRWMPVAFACVGVLALIGSAVYARSISWGGYTYVPVHAPGFEFERWFRPKGAIAVPGSSSGHAYSVFPFASPLSGRLTTTPPDDRDMALTEMGFTLANGSGDWPRQHRYTATNRAKWLSRLNAFSVYLPPLQSDFMLRGESGTSPWEVSPGGVAEKWCGITCSVDVTAPVAPDETRQLRVYVEQPCTSAERPATVSYEVDVMRRGRLVREGAGRLVFTSPAVPQAITLESGSEVPELWRVALRTWPVCDDEIPPRGRSGGGYVGARILFGH